MPETNELAWYWKLAVLLLKLSDSIARLLSRKRTQEKPKRKPTKAKKPKASQPKKATRKPRKRKG
jgi:hypothetical protein